MKILNGNALHGVLRQLYAQSLDDQVNTQAYFALTHTELLAWLNGHLHFSTSLLTVKPSQNRAMALERAIQQASYRTRLAGPS